MITTDEVIEQLLEWRHDKMALVVFTAVMGGDSLTEAWIRLSDVIPTMEDLVVGSKPRAKNRLPINHDLAKRVALIAKEVEPWLQQLAEREA